MGFQECMEKQENEKINNEIVSIVLQKYGVENTNECIYPEYVVKKGAESYMTKINESCTIGELNHSSNSVIGLSEMQESLKKYWSETRSPFTEAYEVPPLPIVDKKEWREFYVPILIERGAIPKDKLVVGKRYYGSCRNASVAVWLGDVFEYQRYKFGLTFPEKINHFEDDDGYDLFVPIRELEEGEEINDD